MTATPDPQPAHAFAPSEPDDEIFFGARAVVARRRGRCCSTPMCRATTGCWPAGGRRPGGPRTARDARARQESIFTLPSFTTRAHWAISLLMKPAKRSALPPPSSAP